MGFQKNNKNVDNARRSGTSNHGKAIPNDAEDQMHIEEGRNNFVNTKTNKVFNKTNARSNLEIYQRGLERKLVMRKLFIQEGLIGFEELPLRSKMTEIINQSSGKLQDLFYDLGVEGKLPKNWDDFKEFVLNYCVEESIFTMEKFKEELWSKYFFRLRDWCKIHNSSEDLMCKKLRCENLPSELRALFYSLDINLDKVYDRIVEYESYITKRTCYQERNSTNTNERHRNVYIKKTTSNVFLVVNMDMIVLSAERRRILKY